jgi:6-pyruvoyltetrahydropterin/6-carboxytetrahydropterin synthase
MYTIRKDFTFDAAHQLHGLAEGHKCGNLHGHTYTVTIELKRANLDENSFVRDYGELKEIKNWIDSMLDHKNLNDVFSCQTSAENIAREIFNRWRRDFPDMVAVEVKETPKTSARYEE